MILHCYAVVTNSEERLRLITMLRHHHTPFEQTGNHVSVDIHCVSYKTVEKLVEFFESVSSRERGFAVIGNREEVPYDSG